MVITSIHYIEIGREYLAVVGPDGLPALAKLEGRGRPRGLTGAQVIAARALRNLNMPMTKIARTLNLGIRPIRTALGAPR
jgi:hypothetical protein